MNKIAVVIPAYKVSKFIESVVVSIPKIVDKIIVIDDKCPEGSGKVVEKLNDERVSVVYHSENQGVGGQ